MIIKKVSEIEGPLELKPKIFSDDRGYLFEFFKETEFKKLGFPNFSQTNISVSSKNVIRGLHFQKIPFEQGKLVMVLSGNIFDVAVDLRPESPTFGKYVSMFLDSEEHTIFYIPPGFAHGFCSMDENTIVVYKNTKEYKPESESGILWNDPAISIDWPITNPIISEKDLSFNGLNDFINGAK